MYYDGTSKDSLDDNNYIVQGARMSNTYSP